MMKFSFVIPVYNCKAYLVACVDSICAAGAEDYEILLIDDGATDGSGAVCDSLATRYPEVRVIHQSNAGASAARNRGIREARGEFLLFLDADDSIDSDALGVVLADPRVLENDMTIYGMTFDYYFHGNCYRRDPMYFAYDGVLTREDWGRAFAALFRDNSLSPVWNKIFRREILISRDLELNTDLFLYEDLEFVLRYMSSCCGIWNVPAAIYHYRQSEDEGNAGRRLKRVDSIPKFLAYIETALGDLPDAVSEEDRALVLQQLYLVLAREKIAVSHIREIGDICRDYRIWAEGRLLPLARDNFQNDLSGCNVLKLYLLSRKTQLRHKIAIIVKAGIHLKNVSR